jgi:Pterin-4a-carbinolamine dehydratase
MRKLEREEIINLLPHGWGLVNDKLVMELQFKTFMDCIKFVDELANLAEGLQHHPDIFISYKN